MNLTHRKALISIGTAILAFLGLVGGSARGAVLTRPPHQGIPEALGLKPEQLAKDYDVNLISSGVSANVLWPGDVAAMVLQFTNKTDAPIKAEGKLEIISYGTRTGGDFFHTEMYRIAEVGSVPLKVEIPPKGYVNVAVQPAIPDRFGGYALVADLGPLGRSFAAAVLRALPSRLGKVQYPAYALDAKFDVGPENMAIFPRLGIKAIRMEWGFHPPSRPDFHQQLARLAEIMAVLARNEVSVMLTMGGGGPQPLGVFRPHLDANAVMMETKFDMAWLPEHDKEFQEQCRIIASAFGWPKGTLNAMELWNEPWEGLSISGWGADMLRYRDIYTAMCQGVEQARSEAAVQVLLGGCCSSMNTLDKLFPDGKDTFLKWLDFTSIHYQPFGAVPALIPEWQNRKNAQGRPDPVRVWDTESWVANTEDRVPATLASMRAQGQSRTAGVYHDAVYGRLLADIQTPTGVRRQPVLLVWSPGVAIAAFQNLVGERPFREILFKNGLPWVFLFDGLKPAAGKDAYSDDGAMVIVGDLGGLFGRERLLFRTVRGLNETTPQVQQRLADLKKQIAAATRPADRRAPEAELTDLQSLKGGSMTISDPEALFRVYDHMGNGVQSKEGKAVVPLGVHGFYVRTDGSKGSFAKLVEAVRKADIQGYEPVEIVARDMLDRVENQPALRLKLTNILNRPIAGKLSVTMEGLTLDPASQEVQLQGHESKEIAVKITGGKGTPANSYAMTAAFDAGGDGKAVHEESMHANVIARRAIKADGDLKDWGGVLPQPIAGPGWTRQDLTEAAWFPFKPFDEKTSSGFATGHLAYDEEWFYFAAKIADGTPYAGNIRFETRDDDQFFYPEKCYQKELDANKQLKGLKELTWPQDVRRYTYRAWPLLPSGHNTDNVQIGFNVIPEDKKAWSTHPKGTMPHFMAWLCTDYEYVLNQVAEKNGGGTEIWRLYAPGLPRKHFYPRQPKAANDGGPVKDAKLAMVRSGNTRTVELALPWSEIPEVMKRLDAGATIKFSFRVNDNGGPSYELAEQRSVSQLNTYSFHDDWSPSWSTETEFAFEKKKAE